MADQTFKITVEVEGQKAAQGVKPVGTALDTVAKKADRARDAVGRFVAGAGRAQKAIEKAVVPPASAEGRWRRLIDHIKRANDESKKLGSTLRDIFATAAMLAFGRQLIDLTDEYTRIQNRIKTVTDSQREQYLVSELVFKSAQETRTELGSLANTYARVKRSTEDLGASQSQVIQFTDTLARALKLSGATAAETASVMLQLSQALQSNRLGGEEFRALAENGGEVMKLFAKELGVTTGQLRGLSRQGKITADVMFRALINGTEDIRKRFGETLPTIKERFVQIKNEAIKFIGELGQRTGIVKGFTDALGGIVENFDTIAKVAVAASQVIITLFVGQALKRLTIGLVTLAATNPFTALAVGIGAALALAIQFSDELEEIIDQLNNIEASAAEKKMQATRERTPALAQAAERASDPRLVARVEEAQQVIALYGSLEEARAQAERNMDASLMESIELVEKFAERQADAALRSMNEIAKNFQKERFKPLVDSVAKDIKAVNEKLQKDIDEGLLNARGKNRLPGLDPKEVDKRIKAFRSLEGEAFSVTRALNEMADAEKVVAQAIATGKVSVERGNEVLAQRRVQLEDQLEPIRAVLSELERERLTLSRSEEQYEETGRLLGILNRFRQDGITATNAEVAAITKEIVALEEARKAKERYKAVSQVSRDITRDTESLNLDTQLARQGVTAPQRRAEVELLRITNDLLDQKIKLTDAETEALRAQLVERALAEEMNEKAVDNLSKLRTAQQGWSDGLTSLRDEIFDIGSQVESAMVNAFHGIEDAIVDLVVNGKADFKGLVDSILADLTRLAVRQALMSGISLLGGGPPLPGFATGGSFTVGGNGGTDSEVVACRATPGEHGEVTRPGGKNGGGGGAPPVVNNKVVVVDDPRKAVDAMASPAGEQVLFSWAKRNAAALRSLLR